MFKVGDYVIHGSHGACKVEKIGPVTDMSLSGETDYSTLTTCYSKSTIITPVDGTKVIMRPILTKDEAENLISGMKDIQGLGFIEEKHREQEYRDVMKTCSCTDLVRIIKTISERRAQRIAQGKKTTSSDEKYFKLAEDSLYGELSISLGISREETKDYVEKSLGDAAKAD